MPKLYILSGQDLGRTVDVSHGAVLGRALDCAVHLRHASVSRHHARLDLAGEEWRIVDLGSRNGVRVRGEPVTTRALADGDEFEVGEVLLRFRGDGPGATTEIAVEREADQGDVVLEEWDDSAPTIGAGARLARSPGALGGGAPGSLASDPRATARATVGAASGAVPGVSMRPDHRILQFRRVAPRAGFFASEIGQQPIWVRAAVVLAALALFALLFWAAFRSTTFLKSRALSHTSDPVSER